MPVTYDIDPSRRLILTTCIGEVRLADVLAHFDVLRRDPRLPATPDVLLVFEDLETLPGARHLHAVADRIGSRPALSFGRCVIVADRDAAYGVARMFEVMAAPHFREITVVRSRDEAERRLAEGRTPTP